MSLTVMVPINNKEINSIMIISETVVIITPLKSMHTMELRIYYRSNSKLQYAKCFLLKNIS